MFKFPSELKGSTSKYNCKESQQSTTRLIRDRDGCLAIRAGNCSCARPAVEPEPQRFRPALAAHEAAGKQNYKAFSI